MLTERGTDERDGADGAFERATVLAAQNRLAEAEEWFARADERGHAVAAYRVWRAARTAQ